MRIPEPHSISDVVVLDRPNPINGVTTEFGQVAFDGATVPADHMVGAPGQGWALAMTVVSHEREPSTLGYSARYGKLVRQMATAPFICAARKPISSSKS